MKFTDLLILAVCLFLVFKSCNNRKDIVKTTIDIVKQYSDYADSVFNNKCVKLDTIKFKEK